MNFAFTLSFSDFWELSLKQKAEVLKAIPESFPWIGWIFTILVVALFVYSIYHMWKHTTCKVYWKILLALSVFILSYLWLVIYWGYYFYRKNRLNS